MSSYASVGPGMVGPGGGGSGGGFGGGSGGSGGSGGGCFPEPDPRFPRWPQCENLGCVAGNASEYPVIGPDGSVCVPGGSQQHGPLTFTPIMTGGYSLHFYYDNVATYGLGYAGWPYDIPETAVGIEAVFAIYPGTIVFPNPIAYQYIELDYSGTPGTSKHLLPIQNIYSLQPDSQFLVYGGPNDRLGFTNEDLNGTYNGLNMHWRDNPTYFDAFYFFPILIRFGYYAYETTCPAPARP